MTPVTLSGNSSLYLGVFLPVRTTNKILYIFYLQNAFSNLTKEVMFSQALGNLNKLLRIKR